MSIQYGEPDMTGSYGVVDSFPKDFGYGGDEAGIDDDSSASADTQPRILLMGLRRSGKSSIQKVRWFTYTYLRVKTCTLRLLQKCVLFFFFICFYGLRMRTCPLPQS